MPGSLLWPWVSSRGVQPPDGGFSFFFFFNCIFNPSRGCCGGTCLETPLTFLSSSKAERTVAVPVPAVGPDDKGTRVLVPEAAEHLHIRTRNHRALGTRLSPAAGAEHARPRPRAALAHGAGGSEGRGGACRLSPQHGGARPPGRTWCRGFRKPSGVALLSVPPKEVAERPPRGGLRGRSRRLRSGSAQPAASPGAESGNAVTCKVQTRGGSGSSRRFIWLLAK